MEWRIEQSPCLKELRIVKMAHVVHLVFRFGSVVSHNFADVFKIGKGIRENETAGHLKKLLLPRELEFLVLSQGREKTEVHRTHIERCHFGLEGGDRLGSLFDGHPRPSTRGDADDDITPLFDGRDNFPKNVQIRGRFSILGVPRVYVDDGSSGFG